MDEGAGGIAAGGTKALIDTLDLFIPSTPPLTTTVAAILNAQATQLDPGIVPGNYQAPFANLAFRQKAEVFRRLEALNGPEAGALSFLAGNLPGLVAFLVYADPKVGYKLSRYRASPTAGASSRGTSMRDVIVVGAGGGGAVVAKELAQRGLDVLLLEAGPRWAHTEKQWSHYEAKANNPASGYFRFGPSDLKKGPWRRDLPQYSYLWQTGGVGGSTVHYFGNCPRPPRGIFAGGSATTTRIASHSRTRS